MNKTSSYNLLTLGNVFLIARASSTNIHVDNFTSTTLLHEFKFYTNLKRLSHFYFILSIKPAPCNDANLKIYQKSLLNSFKKL